MIVWQGRGFIVPLFYVLAYAVVDGVRNALGVDPELHKSGLMAAAGLIAAIACYGVGTHLKKKSARILIDAETGIPFVTYDRDTFFFISVDHWGPLIVFLIIIGWLHEYVSPWILHNVM